MLLHFLSLFIERFWHWLLSEMAMHCHVQFVISSRSHPRPIDIRHFDQDGHYIRKKDEFENHDKWLSGLTKEDIAKVFLFVSRRGGGV
jgi:hypothetical protein